MLQELLPATQPSSIRAMPDREMLNLCADFQILTLVLLSRARKCPLHQGGRENTAFGQRDRLR